MAKKKKCPECPAGEKWAVPYADFLSLLLALFIALWAISQTDAGKANALKESFIQVFDFPDSRSPNERLEQKKKAGDFDREGYSTSTLAQDAQKDNKNNERYNIALDQAENQVAIDLPAAVLFANGSAAIQNDEMAVFLRTVSMIISKLPNSVDVEVRGFADDYEDYVENYRLSAQRGFAVLNHLIANGADAKRMQFSAYGSNNLGGWRNLTSEGGLKIAKIYFRVDRNDIKTQRSVLDVIAGIN